MHVTVQYGAREVVAEVMEPLLGALERAVRDAFVASGTGCSGLDTFQLRSVHGHIAGEIISNDNITGISDGDTLAIIPSVPQSAALSIQSFWKTKRKNR